MGIADTCGAATLLREVMKMGEMRSNSLGIIAAAVLTQLAACGGGGEAALPGAMSGPAPELTAAVPPMVSASAESAGALQKPGQGTLINAPVLNKVLSRQELLSAMERMGGTSSVKLDLPEQTFLNKKYKPSLELNGSDVMEAVKKSIDPAGMACDVAVHAIGYRTVGIDNAITPSSGAVMLPQGSDPRCQGARPVVVYAHGTSAARRIDMARFYDSQAPMVEGLVAAAMFAARGYIVVAPNYVGYNQSTAPHPYINGTQQGREVMDIVQAARTALPMLGVRDSGKLFLTGYSQGGYVAAAAHREFQRSQREAEVTASAPLGAPTAISLLLDYSVQGRPLVGGTTLLPMLTSSWQRQFGDVYRTPQDYYTPRFAGSVVDLLPSDSPAGELVQQGKLAKYLFPPEAGKFPYPAETLPGLSPQALAVNAVRKIAYAPAGAADEALVSMAGFRTMFNDVLIAPCPGNQRPLAGTSMVATWFNSANPLRCTPGSGIRKAAVANDLRNWVPKQPMMMCGGRRDMTVDFDSTLATVGYFAYNGNRNVEALDLEGPALGRYASAVMNSKASSQAILDNFKLTSEPPAPPAFLPVLNGLKNVVAETMISASYHVKAMPFCLEAARTFFDAELAKAGQSS
jgi:pimeloyl-ACP methyl ester carboxylesterase